VVPWARTGVRAGKGLGAPGREPVRTTEVRFARLTDPVAVITGV